MKYFIFDCESTGLGNFDEVIQFSGLLFDETYEILDVVNFYCNTSKLISSEVENVHGLNNKVLNELSEGLFFEDKIIDYPWLYKPNDIVFIGYNVSFDIRMVNNTLRMAGFPEIDFGENVPKVPNKLISNGTGKNYNICLMHTLKQYLSLPRFMKLTQLFEKYVPETLTDIKTIRKNLVDFYKLEDNPYNTKDFHDSLLDSVATVCLFNRFKDFYF